MGRKVLSSNDKSELQDDQWGRKMFNITENLAKLGFVGEVFNHFYFVDILSILILHYNILYSLHYAKSSLT